MAWSTPHTFTTGEIQTAQLWNAAHVENFNFISTHEHRGTPGHGDNDLLGVDSVTFANSSILNVPAPPLDGNTILWTQTDGLMYVIESGGTQTELADSTHDHTYSELIGAQDVINGSATIPIGNTLNDPGSNVSATANITPSRGARVCGVGVFFVSPQGGEDFDVELIIGGVVVHSEFQLTGGLNTIRLLRGSRQMPAGATTVVARLTNNTPIDLRVAIGVAAGSVTV